MDAFHRLSRFGHAAKERAVPIWKAARLRSEPALQWLRLQSERGLQWLKLRPRAVFWVGGIGIALAFLVFGGPLAAGAALGGWAALRQAATASERHQEQTNADRQRRITESFAKAVEQLGSDKLEVRLGGIYSLERISKESPDDYWTVMENLTAFVRERSRRNEQRMERRAYFLWQEAGRPDGRANDFWTAAAREEGLEEPATDIAAVLTVIKRRSEQGREREGANGWQFDLRGEILKRYDLTDAHLEGANLTDAHLVGAYLRGAHLEGASLFDAHLERAGLFGAHLEGAYLRGAHLEGAYLDGAHLEGVDLRHARGLWEARLRFTIGDCATKLPKGMTRPRHWPSAGESADA
jgi:Pentapeptide repeats (8 copies)/Protein of unknown function (DUF2934)